MAAVSPKSSVVQNADFKNQPAPKSQKSMSKAERRELQEKQRAHKAAVAPASSPKEAKSPPSSSTPVPKKAPSTAFILPPSRDRDRDTAGSTGDTYEVSPGKSRGIRIFSHFGFPKPVSHVVKGDVHPAVIRLALQFSSFKICGANARCIATLTSFKNVSFSSTFYCPPDVEFGAQVIRDYKTPPNTTLSRHLMTHLSSQITHLVNARPMSITMGNAIRQLKLEISGSDIDLPEQDVSLSNLYFILHVVIFKSVITSGEEFAISQD